MSKYIYWVKKDLLGCFTIEEDYKCQLYSAFHIRDARSLFAFNYLPPS